MAGKPPGWYDDPAVADRFRWWDGLAWTSWLSQYRDAPPPPGPDRRVVPVPTEVDRLLRALGIVVAVGLVVFALVAGIGVGINRREAAGRSPAAVPSAPGTAVVVPSRMQLTGGNLVIDGVLTMPMPEGSGFDEPENTEPDQGIFEQQYVVHLPGTESSPGTPGAQLHAGLANGGLMHPQYEGTNASVAATQMAYQVFDGFSPVVDQPEVSRHDVQGRPGWTAAVKVRYRGDDGEHTARVTALVVQVDDWTWVLWTAAWTDAMTQAQRRAMEQSQEGIVFV